MVLQSPSSPAMRDDNLARTEAAAGTGATDFRCIARGETSRIRGERTDDNEAVDPTAVPEVFSQES